MIKSSLTKSVSDCLARSIIPDPFKLIVSTLNVALQSLIGRR